MCTYLLIFCLLLVAQQTSCLPTPTTIAASHAKTNEFVEDVKKSIPHWPMSVKSKYVSVIPDQIPEAPPEPEKNQLIQTRSTKILPPASPDLDIADYSLPFNRGKTISSDPADKSFQFPEIPPPEDTTIHEFRESSGESDEEILTPRSLPPPSLNTQHSEGLNLNQFPAVQGQTNDIQPKKQEDDVSILDGLEVDASEKKLSPASGTPSVFDETTLTDNKRVNRSPANRPDDSISADTNVPENFSRKNAKSIPDAANGQTDFQEAMKTDFEERQNFTIPNPENGILDSQSNNLPSRSPKNGTAPVEVSNESKPSQENISVSDITDQKSSENSVPPVSESSEGDVISEGLSKSFGANTDFSAAKIPDKSSTDNSPGDTLKSNVASTIKDTNLNSTSFQDPSVPGVLNSVDNNENINSPNQPASTDSLTIGSAGSRGKDFQATRHEFSAPQVSSNPNDDLSNQNSLKSSAPSGLTPSLNPPDPATGIISDAATDSSDLLTSKISTSTDGVENKGSLLTAILSDLNGVDKNQVKLNVEASVNLQNLPAPLTSNTATEIVKDKHSPVNVLYSNLTHASTKSDPAIETHVHPSPIAPDLSTSGTTDRTNDLTNQSIPINPVSAEVIPTEAVSDPIAKSSVSNAFDSSDLAASIIANTDNPSSNIIPTSDASLEQNSTRLDSIAASGDIIIPKSPDSPASDLTDTKNPTNQKDPVSEVSLELRPPNIRSDPITGSGVIISSNSQAESPTESNVRDGATNTAAMKNSGSETGEQRVVDSIASDPNASNGSKQPQENPKVGETMITQISPTSVISANGDQTSSSAHVQVEPATAVSDQRASSPDVRISENIGEASSIGSSQIEEGIKSDKRMDTQISPVSVVSANGDQTSSSANVQVEPATGIADQNTSSPDAHSSVSVVSANGNQTSSSANVQVEPATGIADQNTSSPDAQNPVSVVSANGDQTSSSTNVQVEPATGIADQYTSSPDAHPSENTMPASSNGSDQHQESPKSGEQVNAQSNLIPNISTNGDQIQSSTRVQIERETGAQEQSASSPNVHLSQNSGPTSSISKTDSLKDSNYPGGIASSHSATDDANTNLAMVGTSADQKDSPASKVPDITGNTFLGEKALASTVTAPADTDTGPLKGLQTNNLAISKTSPGGESISNTNNTTNKISLENTKPLETPSTEKATNPVGKADTFGTNLKDIPGTNLPASSIGNHQNQNYPTSMASSNLKPGTEAMSINPESNQPDNSSSKPLTVSTSDLKQQHLPINTVSSSLTSSVPGGSSTGLSKDAEANQGVTQVSVPHNSLAGNLPSQNVIPNGNPIAPEFQNGDPHFTGQNNKLAENQRFPVAAPDQGVQKLPPPINPPTVSQTVNTYTPPTKIISPIDFPTEVGEVDIPDVDAPKETNIRGASADDGIESGLTELTEFQTPAVETLTKTTAKNQDNALSNQQPTESSNSQRLQNQPAASTGLNARENATNAIATDTNITNAGDQKPAQSIPSGPNSGTGSNQVQETPSTQTNPISVISANGDQIPSSAHVQVEPATGVPDQATSPPYDQLSQNTIPTSNFQPGGQNTAPLPYARPDGAATPFPQSVMQPATNPYQTTLPPDGHLSQNIIPTSDFQPGGQNTAPFPYARPDGAATPFPQSVMQPATNPYQPQTNNPSIVPTPALIHKIMRLAGLSHKPGKCVIVISRRPIQPSPYRPPPIWSGSFNPSRDAFDFRPAPNPRYAMPSRFYGPSPMASSSTSPYFRPMMYQPPSPVYNPRPNRGPLSFLFR
nr:PREDICTED: mucin-16-like isoform X2 [Bemisia tabaci]